MLTRELANKIGLFFILTDNFLKIELKSVDFRAQYIFYFIFIVYYILVRRVIVVNLRYVIYIFVIACVLAIASELNASGVLFFVKQFLLISFNLLFAYLLINAYNFDFIKLFKDYIDLIFLAALVGVIQAFSLASNFLYGADYSYLGFEMGNFGLGYTRIQSWFEEPSVMALAFLPAVFICLARVFKLTDFVTIQKSLFIIVVFLLTQSSIGLLGFMISIFMIVVGKYSFFRNPHLVLFGFGLLILIGVSLYSIRLVKIRVDDTRTLFFDPFVSTGDINKTNLSTYAVYSNYKVAMSAFHDHPLFGTGLGTHELNYEKYINSAIPPNVFRSEFQLNRKDANSLLLRCVSEMGLFGLFLLVWFIFSNRKKLNLQSQNRNEVLYWIFNSAVLVQIIARLGRQGHYTMLGFMLIILIYFFTRRVSKVNTLNESSSDVINS